MREETRERTVGRKALACSAQAESWDVGWKQPHCKPFLTWTASLDRRSHLTLSSVSAPWRGTLTWLRYLKLVVALLPFCEMLAASLALPAAAAVLNVPSHL